MECTGQPVTPGAPTAAAGQGQRGTFNLMLDFRADNSFQPHATAGNMLSNQEATTDKKSSNAVCFKGDRMKEDPLSTEIQRQCQGKMIPSMIPTCSIDLAAQDLYTALACHKTPHQPTSLFMKSPFPLRCYTVSSILIPLSCLSSHGI